MSPTIDRAALAKRLDKLGLWRGLTPEQRETARHDVAKGTNPWSTEISEEVRFFADGEDLAEGGVEEFLGEFKDPLERLGVKYVVRRILGPDTGKYSVAINDISVVLYDENAWKSKVDTEHPWYASTVRPLTVLNRLLGKAGAIERMFTLYTGGNEGIVLLIVPAIVDVLRDAGLTDKREWPMLAEE